MMSPEAPANATGTVRVPLHRPAQFMGHDSLGSTMLYVRTYKRFDNDSARVVSQDKPQHKSRLYRR
jgi:hypothetical protein